MPEALMRGRKRPASGFREGVEGMMVDERGV